MNEFTKAQEALSKIIHEIIALGDPPDAFLLESDEEFGDSWRSLRAYIVRHKDDRLTHYFEQWPWRGLPTKTKVQNESYKKDQEIRELLGLRERPDNYWKSVLARNIKDAVLCVEDKLAPDYFDVHRMSDESIAEYRAKCQRFLKLDFERFVRVVSEAEKQYLSESEKWVSERLQLEKRLFEISPSIGDFRRGISSILATAKTRWPHMGPAGLRFMREFWGDVLTAFDRYYRTRETQRFNVLTKVGQADNLKLADKLKKKLDRTLLNLPGGFEPGYEHLSEKLGEFLEAPESNLTPIRGGEKSPRKLLIRELFSTWYHHAGELEANDPPISPVKHVLNLVRVVDPDITIRVVQLEHELFKKKANSV